MSTRQKNYIQFIKDLQSKFARNLNKDEDQKTLFAELKTKIATVFKFTVTFDSTIVKSLIRRLEEQYKHYYYEDSFIRTLTFIEKFTKVIKKQNFIGKRHQNIIIDKMNLYRNDPCFDYFSKIVYLRTASNREEFRADFFWKYMGIKDEEQIESYQDQELQKQYNSFWKKLFGLNPNRKLIVYIYSCFSKFQDSQKILNSTVRQQINKFIGDDVGKTQIQIQFNQELRSLAIQNYFQNSLQAKQRVNKEYESIQNLLHKFSGTKKIQELKLQLKVAKFGSLISGFAGSDSDLDITVLTNTYVNQNSFLMFLFEFLKVEFAEQDKKTGRITKVQKIDASTPLVQVQITQNRRDTKFKLDILVNNTLGVINSKLLSVYSKVPWIKQLGILFKLWAKTNGVISQTLLSSYAVIMMMIYFLIKRNYVNLIYSARNRNKQTSKFIFKRMKNGAVQQFEVFYQFKTDPEEVTSLKNVNLAEMLKELFQFYTLDGDHWRTKQGKNIVSIDGTYDKDFDSEFVFTIKDPFDEPHNPGRAKNVNKTFFTDQFKNGFSAFQQLMKKPSKKDRMAHMDVVFQKN